MNHLYIDHPGSHIGIRQNQLVIKKTNGKEQAYPLQQIDRITVTTQANFSGAALNTLFRQSISTLFCSPSGYFRGNLQSSSNGGAQVQRRAAQYRLIPSTDLNLPLATNLIAAKIRNQQRVLYDWNNQHSEALSPYARAVERATSLDALRGYEGQAAKLYFSGLAEKLTGTAFVFTRRERPATDPVNALLSFSYALLQSEFAIAIDHYGMDRFAGFFHASDGDQPALILDLMEPFRPLADRLAIRMLSSQLSPEAFLKKDGQCRLQDGSRGQYLKAWEQLMNQTKLWRGEQGSYRRLIERHTGQWANYLDGQISQPNWWRLSG